MVELRKTKIIATLGPSTYSKESIAELISAGINAVRLNFSYGSYDEFREVIKMVREISNDKGTFISIIADLQGPKMRVGQLEHSIMIHTNDSYYLSANNQENNKVIPLEYNFLPYLKKGEQIYFNDGYLKAEVTEILSNITIIKFLNDGVLKTNAGINIPDTVISNVCLTLKDEQDIRFAVNNDIDYIALSFVQTDANIKCAHDILEEYRSDIKIISKIETKSATQNIESIIDKSDVIMVARGDLAVEIGLENVPMEQLSIIKKAAKKKTPVIIATQMLESMINNPRPTRAEASDISNAVIEKVDALMLSAETSIGKYATEAVETMNKIIRTTEIQTNNGKYEVIMEKECSNEESISNAATLISSKICIDYIISSTKSGKSTLSLSALKPNKYIFAFTNSTRLNNQLEMIRGIRAFKLTETPTTVEALVDITIKILKDNNLLQEKGKLLLTTGTDTGIPGETNSIRILDL